MFQKKLKNNAKYYIELPGMLSDCIGDVTIDQKYAIVQIHPTYSLAIVPFEKESHPTYEVVIFYSNCLAYEHELPVSIYTKKKKFYIEPITNTTNRRSYEIITQVYETMNDIRFGSGIVSFRYPGFIKEVDLQYSTKYHGAEKELSLYATALRQIDPLSEFLCYYRIIESITGGNGKDWIDSNIHRIGTYNFGFLDFGDMAYFHKTKRRTNLFSLYRRKAISRINILNKRLPPGKISYYLYNEVRCGIAHGKNIKEYDFDYNVMEISKDNFIMKMLSRIAIEDKI